MDAFDPRECLRQTIGTERWINSEEQYTITVKDSYDDDLYLPMYLPGECRTEDLPPLPYIEMSVVDAPQETHNVGGDVKKRECYLDFDIYYVHTTKTPGTTFGKTVADEVNNLIFTNRSCSVCTWMEVINSGRELVEGEKNKSVIFHKIVGIYLKDWI